ncbi:MAG TPA: BTAD domain-containing putative transcriptional regulator [Gaiellaceae bacterium]|nr:BTAD domain-containing putative transcriptional regulator [Gaiellaceae bacterium]
MERTLEFRILGPLEVLSDAGPMRVGSSKQRALLGALLLRPNETLSTQRLVDAIWGERPPATAEKLVQGYVHALRKQLGNGVLQTSAPGYRLNVDRRSLDLTEFERLREDARSAALPQAVELRGRALALWRGPALADVVLEGSDRHAVARLNDLRLSTQIEQIDAELALGGHAKVIGELESLVAAHPYQERLAAQLMLALYRSGRQADALDVYRALRRLLDEELGLQPSQELRELEAAILRQDEELAAPALPAAIQTDAVVAVDAVEDPGTESRRRPARRLLVAAGAVAVVALVIAIGVLLARREPASVVAPPNSVAVIDAGSNRVVGTVPVGIRPGPVAYGEGAVWVGNLEDPTLSRIDPVARRVVRNIPLPAAPDALAVGVGAVWVVNARLGTLYRVDPAFDRVTDAVRLGDRAITYTGAGVDVGLGSVWAAFGDSTLARADPAPPHAAGVGSAGTGPAAVVVAFGSIWVANSGDATVQRFSPLTFENGPIRPLTVGSKPTGLAAGEGAIWVANSGDDYITRIDAGDFGFNAARSIPVGDGPTDVAIGHGAVWVAASAAGSISRLDPETNEVTATISVGNPLGGMAVADGLVWTSVQAP